MGRVLSCPLVDERDEYEGLRVGPYTVVTASAMNAAATWLAMGLAMLRGPLLAWRLVDPGQLGIVRGAQLVQRYLRYCHLGLIPGLSKALPTAIGRRDAKEARRLLAVGSTAAVALALVVALPLLLIALVTDIQIARISGLALALAAGLTLTGVTSDLYRAILRAYNQFRTIALATAGESVISVVLVVAGAKLFAGVGMLGGWWLSTLLALAYLAWASRLRAAVRPTVAEASGLALIGLPVMLLSFSDMFLTTVDSVLIVSLRGKDALGAYTPASQFAAYLWQLQAAAAYVLVPRMLATFGERGTLEAIRPQVRTANEAFSLVMPVAAGLLALLGPPFIMTVLPQFAESAPALRALAFGAAIVAVPAAAQALLIAANKEFSYIRARLVGTVVAASGVTACLLARRPLAHVAVAQCVGMGVSALMLGYIAERCFQSRRGAAQRSLLQFVPVVYAVLIATGTRFVTAALLPEAGVWGRGLLETALFGALTWPLVVVAQRRTRVLTEVINAISRPTSRRTEPPGSDTDSAAR